MTDDYITDTTYINIRNPYNRPYTVELDPGYRLLPITRSSQYTVGGQSLDVDEPYQIAIRTGEDTLTVKGQNISALLRAISAWNGAQKIRTGWASRAR